MKKNTLLYILLIVLLLANGFFIIKHFEDKPGHRGKTERGPNNFISRQLDFNESQIQQYKNLRLVHRESMKTYDDDIRVLKDEFFSNISDENVNKSEVDSIATLISEKEKQKEIEIFNHFREVRKICNDSQKERFSSIIKNAIHRRGSRRHNGRSTKRGGGPQKRN